MLCCLGPYRVVLCCLVLTCLLVLWLSHYLTNVLVLEYLGLGLGLFLDDILSHPPFSSGIKAFFTDVYELYVKVHEDIYIQTYGLKIDYFFDWPDNIIIDKSKKAIVHTHTHALVLLCLFGSYIPHNFFFFVLVSSQSVLQARHPHCVGI